MIRLKSILLLGTAILISGCYSDVSGVSLNQINSRCSKNEGVKNARFFNNGSVDVKCSDGALYGIYGSLEK